MPVNRVSGGFRWGTTGKTYPTRRQAEAQGRAIYASGYTKKPSKPTKGQSRGKKT